MDCESFFETAGYEKFTAHVEKFGPPLDGKINVDDYIKIDSGIAAGLTAWVNGDFNYDGKVNIDDYTQFIDANIGTQGPAFYTAVDPPS